MGWLFSPQWRTKEDMVNHIKNQLKNCNVLDTHVSGREFWFVYVGKNKNNEDQNYLCVYLMEKRDGEFGYNGGCDVQAGPYQYSVPKRMVLKASFDNENSKEWLRQWELRHGKEAKAEKEVWKQLKSGDKFLRMVGESSEECIFNREYSKQSIVYTTKEGKVFRCKKNVVALVKIEELV